MALKCLNKKGKQITLTFLLNVAFCWFAELDHPIAGIVVPGGSQFSGVPEIKIFL